MSNRLVKYMNCHSINRGEQLKFARKYRGYLSIIHLSNEVNTDASKISRFEKGFVEGALNDVELNNLMSFLKFPIQFLDKHMTNTFVAHEL